MEIGWRDLVEAIERLRLAVYFAWSDTKARYRRSFLGPFWLVLSTMVGVVGLGLVWSVLLRVDRAEFIPSLTIGLIVWQLISGCLAEGPAVFYRQASQIKDINLPSFFVSTQLILRQLVNLFHNIIVFIVVLAIFPRHASLLALLAIPGLILVIFNLLWVVQILGYVGARFRDVEPLVVAFLPILFFLSPVIYHARQLGAMEPIMALNPIGYWIGLIRDPVLGVVPSVGIYLFALAVTVAGWAAALWLTARKRHRLPYWI